MVLLFGLGVVFCRVRFAPLPWLPSCTGLPPFLGKDRPLSFTLCHSRAFSLTNFKNASMVRCLLTLLFGFVCLVLFVWVVGVLVVLFGFAGRDVFRHCNRHFAVDWGLPHAFVDSSTCNISRGGPFGCGVWRFGVLVWFRAFRSSLWQLRLAIATDAKPSTSYVTAQSWRAQQLLPLLC